MNSTRFLTISFLFAFSFCFSQIEIGVEGMQGAVLLHPEAPQTTDPEINRVISIVNSVETKNNFIDQLNPDSNVSLPFGIIKQIGGVRYVIAIDSMKFQPQGAYFSAYAAIDFPGTLKKLAFRGSHIKFNPIGVISGDQAKLYLASDHLIRINQTVSLKLLSNGENWVEWDCNGFKAIRLKGNFVFQKGKFLPDPTETSDTVVTASFEIRADNIHNFIAAVNITPFMINGLQDWGFIVKNAIVDMSELSNANTMIFPAGYPNLNNVTPQMWTGFSMQSLKIKLPKELSKTGKRTEVEAANVLIDHMGVTGVFKVNNIFQANEGSMNGWDFSIDELGVGFTCNQLSSGHLKGNLSIPIIDSAPSLQYSSDVIYNPITKDVDYMFSVKPTSNVKFDVFSADVILSNNSSISVTKVNGYFRPVAKLNGLISFTDNKLNSNGGQLAFQDLTITTEVPFVTNGIFTLHNINGGQTKSGFYPISIDDITIGISRGAPILGFNVKLNLSELLNNSLTVSTSILIKGKIESTQTNYETEANTNPNKGRHALGESLSITKTKWSFDKVIINGVVVNIETSPFTLNGNILFNDSDPVYGTGFFGLLDLSIKKIIEEPIGITVGFGAKENYRYFFLDAKVPAKYIVPSTPIGLSRIIGGLYYHMAPSKITEPDLIALNQNFNNINGSALTYVPSQSVAIGLKMGVSAEFVLNESVCNGDFFLDVHFTNAGGLGPVTLAGNMYSMAKVSNRISAPIKGRLDMSFDPQTKTFDALATVDVSYYNIIKGYGYFKAHFDPKDWYVCIGKPSAPNNIKFLDLVEAPSYFMTGNSIELASPPPIPVSNGRDEGQLKSGRGFCAGARIHSQMNRSINLMAFSINYNYSFDLGFDLMMADYGENATCQGSAQQIGMNGRLAQGEMYLLMNGGASIGGRYKVLNNCPNTYELCTKLGCCCEFTVGCITDVNYSEPIFEGSVNARVYAKLPKPLYFSGRINATYRILGLVDASLSFDYNYGDDCNPVTN